MATNLMAQSVALMALKSYSNRYADRSCLRDGENYPKIDLKVKGSVNGQAVQFAIAGQLSVSEAHPTGSTVKPQTDRLLAALFSFVPKTKIKAIEQAAASNKLPTPGDDDLKRARAIIKSLSKTGPRAGSVFFVEG